MYPPPVNPNGKGGLFAQAFAGVIFGLCKFNIKCMGFDFHC